MNRAELDDDQARSLLATAVRNHFATPRLIFPVWDGFDLQWRDGELYRARDGKKLIAGVNTIYGMSDEEIERAVLGKEAGND